MVFKIKQHIFSQISKLSHYRSCLRFTLFKSEHTYRQTFDSIILWLICAKKLQIWAPMDWICKVVFLLKIFSYYITSIRGKFPLQTDCGLQWSSLTQTIIKLKKRIFCLTFHLWEINRVPRRGGTDIWLSLWVITHLGAVSEPIVISQRGWVSEQPHWSDLILASCHSWCSEDRTRGCWHCH